MCKAQAFQRLAVCTCPSAQPLLQHAHGPLATSSERCQGCDQAPHHQIQCSELGSAGCCCGTPAQCDTCVRQSSAILLGIEPCLVCAAGGRMCGGIRLETTSGSTPARAPRGIQQSRQQGLTARPLGPGVLSRLSPRPGARLLTPSLLRCAQCASWFCALDHRLCYPAGTRLGVKEASSWPKAHVRVCKLCSAATW